MNGTILLPSLNRPELVKRFLKSYKETESVMPGMLLVDKGDPSRSDYEQLDLPEGWQIIWTDAITMGDKFRETWDLWIDKDFVTILNDDHIIRGVIDQKTGEISKDKTWDQMIASQITGTNIIATNDNYRAPERLAGAITISCKILKTLGWIFPEGVQHLYSDSAWEIIAGGAQCAQILMDVMVEHDHAYKDPKQQDETFKKINGEQGLVNGEGSGGFWPGDKAAFQKWLNEKSRDDIKKILAIQPKTGVMICTPCQDSQVSIEFAIGLSDASVNLSKHGIWFEFGHITGSSLLAHARNTLVDMFLNSRCQKLLFIDSDQGFNADAIFRLLNSSRPIIAGVVPHKRWPINLNFEPLPEDDKYFANTTNKSLQEFSIFVKEKGNQLGEVEVNRSGTGFMMIDRKVLELMKEHVTEYCAYDNPDKQNEKHYEFFKMGPTNGKYKGEDWFFCELAKKLKIPIYISAFAQATHRGTYLWSIQ